MSRIAAQLAALRSARDAAYTAARDTAHVAAAALAAYTADATDESRERWHAAGAAAAAASEVYWRAEKVCMRAEEQADARAGHPLYDTWQALRRDGSTRMSFAQYRACTDPTR